MGLMSIDEDGSNSLGAMRNTDTKK